MSFLQITCPHCSSHRVERADASHYRCVHCHSIFLRNTPPPAPPASPHGQPAAPVPTFAAVPPRQPGDSSGKARSVVLVAGLGIVAFAVVSCVVFALVLGGQTPAREPQSPTGAEPIAALGNAASTETAPPPEARIASLRKGVVQGKPFFIATYENTGKTPIGNASVRVSSFDASGRRIDEATGYAVHKNLPPGESTPVLILGNTTAGVAKTEASVVPAEPSSAYDASQLAMTVTDFTERSDTYRTDVVGTVQNPTKTPVQFVRVVVTGLDEQGQAVSYADTFATFDKLQPGGASGFTVSVGAFQITKPTRYRVFALAMPNH